MESKTLKVDTYDIMRGLENEISQSDLFSGRKMPPLELQGREEDKFAAMMAICTIKESKGLAQLYKQSREEQIFSSVALLCDGPLE